MKTAAQPRLAGEPTSNQALRRAFNAAPHRLQAKLTVGSNHDSLEREADRTADHVLRGIHPANRPSISSAAGSPRPVLQTKGGAGRGTPTTAPASVHTALAEPGRPLDTSERKFFEPRFGSDFSSVRVHTGDTAARSAQDIGARAYTAGDHIVFAERQHSSRNPQGAHLLAHELTHVVQQQKAGADAAPMIRRAPWGTCPEGPPANTRNPFIYGAAEAYALLQYTARFAGHCLFTNEMLGADIKPNCGATDQPLVEAIFRHFHRDKQRRKPTVASPDNVTRRPEGKTGALVDQAMETVNALQQPDIVDVTSREVYDITTNKQRYAKNSKFNRRYLPLLRIITGATWSGGTKLTPFAPATVKAGSNTICYGPTDFARWPGVIQYRAIKDKKDSSSKKKKKGEKEEESKKKKKEEEKEDDPKKAGKGGNVGFGIGIFSSGGGSGNATLGVSIDSHGQSYGTVSAGVVYDANGNAVGTATAGAAAHVSGNQALNAAAGASKDTSGDAAASAHAGTSNRTDTESVATAGKGSSKDTSGISAGTAVKGDSKDADANSFGHSGKAGGEGGGSGKAAENTAEGDGSSDGGQHETDPSKAGQGSTPGKGSAQGVPEGTGKEGSGTGKGTGTGKGDANADTNSGKSQGGSHGGTALTIPGKTAAESRKILQQAAEIDALLQKATPAQKHLLTYLSQGDPNLQYEVAGPEWVRSALDGTSGFSEADIASLESAQWQPGQATPQEMRRSIEEQLKHRKAAPSTSPAQQTDSEKKATAAATKAETPKKDDSSKKTPSAQTEDKASSAKHKGHAQKVPTPPHDKITDPKAAQQPHIEDEKKGEKKHESREEQIARLVKRLKDYTPGPSSTGMIVWGDTKTYGHTAGAFYFHAFTHGRHILVTADVSGTLTKKGNSDVFTVGSVGLLVSADGQVGSGSFLIGETITLSSAK